MVIAELLFHLMCIHVHEWISNLLSFFSLVFTGGLLRPTGTVHATLGDFHSTWTTREPCRFLPSACILTATNLKDIRMSLILENKILKKDTLKTTRKSSLHFIPREQRFHPWRLWSMGPTRSPYHFKGEIVRCTNLKTNSSCFRILMIAIVNGQLHYIFWNLKKVENSTLYEN